MNSLEILETQASLQKTLLINYSAKFKLNYYVTRTILQIWCDNLKTFNGYIL